MPKPILAETLSRLEGVRHGFFTRDGGVSRGIYGSLNVGLGSRDERESVVENRARVARHLGAQTDHLVTAFQVHSPTALIVEGPITGDLPRVDALITRTPGLVVGALAADCCPVLFADATAKVVAAAHAGWRGALSGVLESTVAGMEQIGAARDRIVAAVGPTISQASYEVGPEFEAEFLSADATAGRFFMRRSELGRPYFDLPGFVSARLTRSGIATVESVAACTYVNEAEFFSYRRATHRGENDYGRQISAIVVA